MTEPTNTTTEAVTVSVDWSRLTLDERIRHIEIEGYVVIPDLIPTETLSQIRDELDRLPTCPTDYSEHQRGCADVQWTDSRACIELIALPDMVAFLTTLLGDELICTSCCYALSQPGHPGIAIHTDAQPYGSKIFGMQSSSPRLVRVLYYLDDLTPECAPLKVIPRSHLSLHADANPYHRYLRHLRMSPANSDLTRGPLYPGGPIGVMAMPTYLEEARAVDVAVGTTVQYWLTVHVDKDAHAGVYEGDILIRREGGAAHAIRLSVEVLPITLVEPTVTLGFWDFQAEPYGGEIGTVTEVYETMRQHGMNAVFTKAGLWERDPEGGTPYDFSRHLEVGQAA